MSAKLEISYETREAVAASLGAIARLSGKLSEAARRAASGADLAAASASHLALSRAVFAAAKAALHRQKFNPNFATQPRVPRGQSEGGQWTRDRGSGSLGVLHYAQHQSRGPTSADDGRGNWRDP